MEEVRERRVGKTDEGHFVWEEWVECMVRKWYSEYGNKGTPSGR